MFWGCGDSPLVQYIYSSVLFSSPPPKPTLASAILCVLILFIIFYSVFLFIVVGYMVVTTMHSYGQLYLSNVPRPGPHRKLGVERFIGEYKFDDERVTKEDAKKALEEQYGGDEELPQINPGFNNAPFKFTKYSNAYMLVYIRESAKEKIMCTVDEKDIAEHLRVRLKKEQEEKEHKKKEKAEAHLYTIIKVARDEDLKEQIGKGIYFDLVDHEKVHNFRIQKQMPFSCFKEEVAKEYGIPVQFQRFWLWAKRQNHTYRPNRPLTVHEETQSVGQLREISNKAHNVELKLFLEVELGLDLRPLPPPEKGKEDILLFFKFYNPEKEELCNLWLLQVVHFRSLEKPKDDDFSLELSKLHTYDDVVERVARQLELDDPAKIRLTPHNCYSQQPKPQPVKYRGVVHLSDMLIHYNQTSDILYYEVLDIPLPELQFLKTLKVAFHHPTKDEVVIHSIRLPKNSTIADVIYDLKTKVELSSPNAELRVLEVFYHKIYKIFPLHEKIENINDQYWTLRAEEIPEEEKNIGPNDRLIHVYHFKKDINQTQQIQNFGDPFVLVVHEGETLAEVKKRIQSKLQVSADEFSKWKFAFISMNRPDYLQDSDVVPTGFQRREVYGAWEQYLGIEHADTAPKRVYTVNQFHHSHSIMQQRPSSPTVAGGGAVGGGEDPLDSTVIPPEYLRWLLDDGKGLSYCATAAAEAASPRLRAAAPTSFHSPMQRQASSPSCPAAGGGDEYPFDDDIVITPDLLRGLDDDDGTGGCVRGAAERTGAEAEDERRQSEAEVGDRSPTQQPPPPSPSCAVAGEGAGGDEDPFDDDIAIPMDYLLELLDGDASLDGEAEAETETILTLLSAACEQSAKPKLTNLVK
ncbi:Ubiquitin carboxyl-terminal hydrolase 13 [Zea mays]|uniref:ubiquitinyl hydrolase 1 n=1 Tax=Zea mays TaxID=4577 RepID=A0A1D6QL09_MAIZE|nr:Ubiquitin carboxyl-terminal hydrolase 13 [Zea mays]